MNFKTDIVIGLEIHVELDTKTKLFCSCSTSGSDEPNTRTCEICLGMPGSKPKVNKKALEYAIKLAKALDCKLSSKIVFSRKSYFYPDLAKNFQITQYESPIGEDGFLDFGSKIGIKRVHVEEDPASLIHPGGITNSKYVLVDYNRSGNPLCEVVTLPEIKTPEDAREFMKALITILQYLEIFSPKKNLIKADANVSIKESGYTRVEIKNISGFKEIELALKYEIERQKQLIEEGKKIRQETRAWDAENRVTIFLRSKETEDDYGYITEPDLVPIEITPHWLKKIEIPEMPAEKEKRFVKQYKITEEDAHVITNEYRLAAIFEKAVLNVNPELAAKWIRRELVRVMNYNNIELSQMPIDETQFITLLELLDKKKITDKIAQRILEKLAIEKIDVEDYIKKEKLETVSDNSVIEEYCKEAIAENPKAVDDYKAGKEAALNFLFGSVMKKSKGKADPSEVREMLKKNLAR